MNALGSALAFRKQHGTKSLLRRGFNRTLEGLGHQVCRVGAKMTVMGSAPYHPLAHYQKAGLDRPDEAFEQRWRFVSDAIDKYEVGNFLDLGCAEGYYVRRVALEHGLFAVGVDNDLRRFQRSHAVSLLDADWRCGFVNMKINSASAQRLPAFDLISCMSLLHHIIYHNGLDEARALMTSIAGKTGKCMLFDMGGPDEVSNPWASSLSMFSGDVPKNIIAFLQECNFGRVEMVGTSVGYGGPIERPFFIAEPTGNVNSSR